MRQHTSLGSCQVNGEVVLIGSVVFAEFALMRVRLQRLTLTRLRKAPRLARLKNYSALGNRKLNIDANLTDKYYWLQNKPNELLPLK